MNRPTTLLAAVAWHADGSMNGPRDELCHTCGKYVTILNQFSRRNHRERCHVEQPHESEDEIVNGAEEEVLLVGPEDNAIFTAADGVEAAVLQRTAKGVMTTLEDFDHLTQFMNTGRCVCTEHELQLVKFVHMAHCGYGVSRAFSVGMLKYAKESGGANVHLPDSWGRCVRNDGPH